MPGLFNPPAANLTALAERQYPLQMLDQYGQRMDDDRGFLLGHQRTFAAIWSSLNKTYFYRFDEAMKHSEENSRAMRRDAFIRALLQERYVQLTALGWHLEAEDNRSAAQKEVTSKLTNIVKATDRWTHFVWQLCEAMWYGRMANECRWEAVPVNGENRLCVVDHLPLVGDKIQYGYDGVPKIQVHAQAFEELRKKGIVKERDLQYGSQAPTLALTDPRWRDRFIIHKHICEDADYFDGQMAGRVQGIGLRDLMYWSWWLRDEMLGWMINHAQKIAMGGIFVVYYDYGNEESRIEAEKAAMNAGERYAIAMPRTTGSTKDAQNIQFLQFNEAGMTSMNELISGYLENHLERLVIGQTLSANTDATGLGSGVAKLHEATKLKLLRFDAANMGDTLSKDLVKVAQKWNFPKANFRVRLVFDIPNPDAAANLDAAMKAIQIGVKVKADDIRANASLSAPEKDDEICSQEIVQRTQMGVQIEGQIMLQKAMAQMQAEQQQQAAELQQAAAMQQPQAIAGPQQAAQPQQAPQPQQVQKPVAQPAEQAADQVAGQGQEQANAQDMENQILDLIAGDTEEHGAVAAMFGPGSVSYEATHAPKGGVTIQGVEYPGGRFIPGEVVASASAEEKAVLAAKKAESGEKVPEMPAAGPDQQPAQEPQAAPQNGVIQTSSGDVAVSDIEKIRAMPIVPEDEFGDLRRVLFEGTPKQKPPPAELRDVVWSKMVEFSKIPTKDFAKVAGQMHWRAGNSNPNRTEEDMLNDKSITLVQSYTHARGRMLREQASVHGTANVVRDLSKYAEKRALKIATKPGWVSNQFKDDLINQTAREIAAPLVGMDPKSVAQRERDAEIRARTEGRQARDEILRDPEVQETLKAARDRNADQSVRDQAKDFLYDAKRAQRETEASVKDRLQVSDQTKQKFLEAGSLVAADVAKWAITKGIRNIPTVWEWTKRTLASGKTYADDDIAVLYADIQQNEDLMTELTLLLRDRIKNRIRRQGVVVSESELEALATEQARAQAPLLASMFLHMAQGQHPEEAVERAAMDVEDANAGDEVPTAQEVEQTPQVAMEPNRVYFDDEGTMVIEYGEQESKNTHIDWLPSGGNRLLDIDQLFEMTKDREPSAIRIEALNPELIDRSPKSGFNKEKYKNCDVRIPQLIGPDGRLIDGRHRLAKLHDSGADVTLAHILNDKELDAATIKSNLPKAESKGRFPKYAGTPLSGYGATDEPNESDEPIPSGHIISPEGEIPVK